MPIASGGGGSISRLSMTWTRARYPTARITLTTPARGSSGFRRKRQGPEGVLAMGASIGWITRARVGRGTHR